MSTRGFTKPEDAKPKQPRKNGEPCAGGCGRTHSSQWRGPGSAWCNETCKAKAAAARAELSGDKQSAQVSAVCERMDALEADEEETYKATTKLVAEHKKMASELRAAKEQLAEQAEDISALRQQLARQAQASSCASKLAADAAHNVGVQLDGIMDKLDAFESWRLAHMANHQKQAERRAAAKRPREGDAAPEAAQGVQVVAAAL